jgi:hypothetical protein
LGLTTLRQRQRQTGNHAPEKNVDDPHLHRLTRKQALTQNKLDSDSARVAAGNRQQLGAGCTYGERGVAAWSE